MGKRLIISTAVAALFALTLMSPIFSAPTGPPSPPANADRGCLSGIEAAALFAKSRSEGYGYGYATLVTICDE